MSWKGDDGLPHTGVVTFDRLGPDTTKVTVELDWQPQGLLERVVANLAANAFRHAPRDRPVRIEAGEFGDSVDLRIVDRGEGVPAADR